MLRIVDDGQGIPSAPKRSGGLSNMMWRAAELGGTCSVGANTPSGTVLEWRVPV
jgi:signal transduction histidine kinase